MRAGSSAPSSDEVSLHLAMNVRYVPGERTLFRHIRRLSPGHVLEFHDGEARVFSYTGIDWTPDDSCSEGDWIEGIRAHYQAAVKRQLLSDVPVGVSLSGGIDSNSIVAMLRRTETGPIMTFSLGFDEPWDELEDARFVARTFETEHHERCSTSRRLSTSATRSDTRRSRRSTRSSCICSTGLSAST